MPPPTNCDRKDIESTMMIGYARVSTQDQSLELQIAALKKAGCKKIMDDKLSGSRAERPGLTKLLEMLRKGDTFDTATASGRYFFHVMASLAENLEVTPRWSMIQNPAEVRP